MTENACRSCAQSSSYCLMVFETYNNYVIAQIVADCVGQQVEEGDGLPLYICLQCTIKFVDAHELKNLYVSSCEHWRQKIKDKLLTTPATDSSFNENPLEMLDKLTEQTTEVNGTWEVNFPAQEAETDFDYYEELFDNRAQHEILFSEQPAPVECTEKSNSSTIKDTDTEKEDSSPKLTTTAKKGPISKKEKQSLNKNREKSTNNEDILCDHCNKIFPNQRSYNRHQNYNKLLKTKCPLCAKEFAHKSNLKRHLTTHKDQKLACEKCNSQFTDHTLLYEHMKTHRFDENVISNLDDYVIGCELCNSLRTTSFAVFTNHMRTEHDFENVDKCKPFVCRICSLKFASKQGMLRHIDNIHENNRRNLRNRDKNYLCTMCGKKFYTNFHLEVHVRSHTGFKPFSCSVCGKKFSQMSGLQMHLYTHTGEKPFRCKIANCGKSFNQYGHVREHMLTHSDKKPWKCHICLHSFRVKGNLTAHLMIHTNKHYTCKVEKCGKRFIHSTKLRQHHEKHHAETETQ